jgi:uncharacterized membrane protein YgdD (TMEM256/DUF423 family)
LPGRGGSVNNGIELDKPSHAHKVDRMHRTFLILGSLSALLSVAAGAFGAHALKQRLEPTMLATFETAARYEMYHALALIAVGLLLVKHPSGAATTAGWAFVSGTVLFSGSLYVMVFTGLRWLGAITPIGGTAFLVGWAALAAAAWRATP